MPEYWDLKILAKSEAEARKILDQAIALLQIVPRDLTVQPYWKFDDYWECRFNARPELDDPNVSNMESSAARFLRLAVPGYESTDCWQDEEGGRERWEYEALTDARRDMVAVFGVMWVSLTSQSRGQRPEAED